MNNMVKIHKVVSEHLVILDYSDIVPDLPLSQGFLEIVQEPAATNE
jgi:hypothetical protein